MIVFTFDVCKRIPPQRHHCVIIYAMKSCEEWTYQVTFTFLQIEIILWNSMLFQIIICNIKTEIDLVSASALFLLIDVGRHIQQQFERKHFHTESHTIT